MIGGQCRTDRADYWHTLRLQVGQGAVDLAEGELVEDGDRMFLLDALLRDGQSSRGLTAVVGDDHLDRMAGQATLCVDVARPRGVGRWGRRADGAEDTRSVAERAEHDR